MLTGIHNDCATIDSRDFCVHMIEEPVRDGERRWLDMGIQTRPRYVDYELKYLVYWSVNGHRQCACLCSSSIVQVWIRILFTIVSSGKTIVEILPPIR